MIRYLVPVTLMPLLASCVAPSTPPPATPAPPVARPAPAPAPVPVADRYAGDWSVDELTPGEWVLRHQVLYFTDDSDRSMVQISCSAPGIISLARNGTVAQEIPAGFRIRTSSGERTVPIEIRVQGRTAQGNQLIAGVNARDPLWDSILYSRGRFVIETTMQAPLILPTRPALQRVVEDCRG